jgi:excisionase family DNA binding protein
VNDNGYPILVSPDRGAAMIGCGKTFLYELIATGKIEAKKQGRSTVIPVDSLREYAASLPSIPTKQAS